MKRIIFQELKKWITSSSRKPILLRGARQVGKTYVVRQLGKLFDNYVEINFEKTPELMKIFEYDLDPIRIVREISIATKISIEPENTLLFIDEIQEAPRAIIALRYFYEEMPNLHVIAAGSLVDFAIEKVGVPVGRLSFLYMYPLSFIEYLSARGHNLLASEIINHEPAIMLNEALHTKALRLLAEYMAIGGMPKSVASWIDTQNIESCTNALNDIKNTYEQDFNKYTKKNEIKYVDLLFQQIPSQICKTFNYGLLTTTYRKRELEPALRLLEKAGIIQSVLHSSSNGIPLGSEVNFSKFKLIPLDVGLNQAILGLELKDWFLDPVMTLVNKGEQSESFVGQELLAYSNPSSKHQLYYWQREEKSSQAKVDYVITHQRNIIPVQVKSGHGGSLQSMRLFLKSHPNSSYGIRFSTHNYSVHDSIHSFPLYAVAGALENKQRLLDFCNTD